MMPLPITSDIRIKIVSVRMIISEHSLINVFNRKEESEVNFNTPELNNRSNPHNVPDELGASSMLSWSALLILPHYMQEPCG